ncbi:MAG: hypothetical protein KGR26_13680 [Cyanobacteria bacterium REEB65]|nr:hypothetical protein [Cyanobacteria bacterium REEB65]
MSCSDARNIPFGEPGFYAPASRLAGRAASPAVLIVVGSITGTTGRLPAAGNKSGCALPVVAGSAGSSSKPTARELAGDHLDHLSRAPYMSGMGKTTGITGNYRQMTSRADLILPVVGNELPATPEDYRQNLPVELRILRP